MRHSIVPSSECCLRSNVMVVWVPSCVGHATTNLPSKQINESLEELVFPLTSGFDLFFFREYLKLNYESNVKSHIFSKCYNFFVLMFFDLIFLASKKYSFIILFCYFHHFWIMGFSNDDHRTESFLLFVTEQDPEIWSQNIILNSTKFLDGFCSALLFLIFCFFETPSVSFFQMGEKWKNMSDKEKRQYFEASKQNRLDHKKVSFSFVFLWNFNSKKTRLRSSSAYCCLRDVHLSGPDPLL